MRPPARPIFAHMGTMSALGGRDRVSRTPTVTSLASVGLPGLTSKTPPRISTLASCVPPCTITSTDRPKSRSGSCSPRELISPMSRRALVVSIALVMAGCGGPSRVTASSPPSGRAWLAGHLPAGFVMVRAEEQGGGRTVGYAPRPQAEPQISITASSSATESPGQRSRPVRVRGHAATLATLFDEGQPYGFSVTWDERPGLQLIVEGTNGPTEQETLAVAERVHAVSEPDWQRLLIELSPDTHMGRVDPSAVPTEALRGSIGGADYVLTALVPGGFPLGADDRRLDCYRLTYRGETTKKRVSRSSRLGPGRRTAVRVRRWWPRHQDGENQGQLRQPD